MYVELVPFVVICLAASFVAPPLMIQGRRQHGYKAGHGNKAYSKVAPPADVIAAWTLITTNLSAAEAKPGSVLKSLSLRWKIRH